MSQHDYAIADAAGAAFLADLNLALAAAVSNNSGATAPSTTYPYMLWADTTSGWLKQRNAADSAWIKRWPLGTAARTDVASAATLDLTANAVNSDYLRITGTTTVTAVTLEDGQRKFALAGGAFKLTNGASLVVPGSADYTCTAGDLLLFIAEALSVVRVMVWKGDGTPVVSAAAGSTCLGAFRNLAVSATGTNASIACSAEEVVVENGSNQYMTLRSWSRTINSATSGAADALDTGTIAASTWYSVWAIAKSDGTQGGLISLSASAPTLPSGYTYKARVGWIRTDGTGNKYPLSFKQLGRKATYVIAAGSNVTAYPSIATGTSGTFSAGTYTPTTQSVSSFVPSTASHIRLYFNSQNTAVSAAVTPNGAASWTGYGSNPAPEISFYGGASMTTFTTDMMLESTNIYWANSTGASFVMACGGWEDNL